MKTKKQRRNAARARRRERVKLRGRVAVNAMVGTALMQLGSKGIPIDVSIDGAESFTLSPEMAQGIGFGMVTRATFELMDSVIQKIPPGRLFDGDARAVALEKKDDEADDE